VYRALNSQDVATMARDEGIVAKNSEGEWSLAQHLVKGLSRTSRANDPWISTTWDESVAQGLNESGSKLGVVAINLDRVSSATAVVGVLFLHQEHGVVSLGVERAGGDGSFSQVQVCQQRLEAGDLIGFSVHVHLGEHSAGFLVRHREQVRGLPIRAGVAGATHRFAASRQRQPPAPAASARRQRQPPAPAASGSRVFVSCQRLPAGP